MAWKESPEVISVMRAPEQAAVIREMLGIRKGMAVSIGHRERPRRIGFASRPQEMPTLAARIGGNEAA